MKYRIRYYFPTTTHFQIVPEGPGREVSMPGFCCYVSVFDENQKEQSWETTTEPMTIEDIREYLVTTGNQPLGHDVRYCLGICDQELNRIKFKTPIDFFTC